MKKILLPALLSGLLCSASFVPLSAETLDEAIVYAVANHPSVKAADAGRDAAFETVREQRAAYFPDVSLGAAAGRIYANNTTTRGLTVTRGAGYSWFGEGSANITQTVYDWSQTSNRVNAARARHLSADATVEERKAAIAYQAAQAYIQMLRALALRQKAELNLQTAEDYMARIETLVNDGGADESELSRAKDVVTMGRNTLIRFEADYQIAMASYIEAVGRMPEGELSEPSFDLGQVPDDIDRAIEYALSHNPQIAAAAYEAKAAGYDIKSAKADILPKLNAELSYLKRDQRDVIGGESEDGRALLRMTWDYSVGGAQLAAQRRTANLAEEAAMNREALKRVIMRDVRVAWAGLEMAQRQKDNEARRLKAAQATLATYKEQYTGAQKTVLDLMQADAQVFNADIAHTNMYYSELDAAFALATTLGLLREATVTPVADQVVAEIAVPADAGGGMSSGPYPYRKPNREK